MNRILFYYHHFGGLGHGMRVYSLCKAIKSIDPRATILVINSGLPQPELEIKKYASVIDLPDLSTKNSFFARKALLEHVAASYKPDAAVFEHFPFGRQLLAPEIIPFIGLLKQNGARIYSSARDIIAQDVDLKILLRQAGLFSAIFIHADTNSDFLTSFKQPIKLLNKIVFTGRVCCLMKNELKTKNILRKSIGIGKRRLILINNGGGRDGFDMLKNVIAAKPMLTDDILYLIAAGPSIADDNYKYLKKIAQQEKNIILRKFVHDFTDHVNAADLYITMGGYNSINNILLTGTSSIVFPRRTDKEQVLRAAKYRALFQIADSDSKAKYLADKIRSGLRSKQRSLFHKQYFFDGAKKTAAFLNSALSINTLKIRLHTYCNADCGMCSWKEKIERLPYKNVLKILDQASLLGIKNINFTGGEPSIYPEIIQALKYAKDKGFYVSISSNGIWPKRIRGTIANTIDSADLSIDAGNKEDNDLIRGKSGYFKSALRTLAYLLEKNKPVHVNVTVRPDNAGSLSSIIDMLPRRVSSVSFTLVDNTLKKDPRLLFSHEKLLEYFFKEVPLIMKRAADKGIRVSFGPSKKPRKNGKCPRQKDVLRINSDGAISFCCFLDDSAKDIGNIMKEGLIDIITSDKFLDLRKNQIPGKGICKNCKGSS